MKWKITLVYIIFYKSKSVKFNVIFCKLKGLQCGSIGFSYLMHMNNNKIFLLSIKFHNLCYLGEIPLSHKKQYKNLTQIVIWCVYFNKKGRNDGRKEVKKEERKERRKEKEKKE